MSEVMVTLPVTVVINVLENLARTYAPRDLEFSHECLAVRDKYRAMTTTAKA